MKIAMLSCNTGEGHNSTAKAVRDAMSDHGTTCELIDVLACLSPKFSKFLCNWHTRIYRYGPKLFDKGYRAFERKEADYGETSAVYDLLAFGVRKLWGILEAGQYDAILCTHVFSGMMVTEVRKMYPLNVPCFFVSTDYTCHPFVEQCEMDGYFIPSDELKEEFLAVGLPAEKLISTGIPVQGSFYIQNEKKRVRETLGLPAEGIVLLLMCGSMGCGPMKDIAEELTDRLPENATVVAICGKNEKLYETMSEIQKPGLRTIGYTTQVAAYMDAADLIVTKPGGLSSTEAANKHLPMVFINAVGGCESRNFSYFLACGYAIGSSDPDEVIEQAILLSQNPRQLNRMRENLQEAFVCNSAAQIADQLVAAVKSSHNSD